MLATKKQTRETLAITLETKSKAWLEELRTDLDMTGFTAVMFYLEKEAQTLCIISGCESGLNRDSLRPDRKLGGLLKKLAVNFERVS